MTHEPPQSAAARTTNDVALRIFGAGLATETNDFVRQPTRQVDFHVLGGADIDPATSRHPVYDIIAGWRGAADTQGDRYIQGMVAWAPPGGMTERRTYETLCDLLLAEIAAAMPLDVVLLLLHGAMIADGYPDCEADIIGRVRDLVGPAAAIGVELDLHCHLHDAKIARADIVLTFKEYPHIDGARRAAELFALACATARKQISPTAALFDCRMLGLYPTTRQPMRGFVAAMQEAEQQPGVLSISLGHGFPFADVPHGGAKLLVYTNDDPDLALNLSAELGHEIYAHRRDIGFEGIALPMDAALERALASSTTPMVVADQSDNPGGGAAGDATFALERLIALGATGIGMAIHHDPQAVAMAKHAGVGAAIRLDIGGRGGPLSGTPVSLEARVIGVRENYDHAFPQTSGTVDLFPAGDVAALRCDGIDIIVSSLRSQCFSPSIFTDLGIDPMSKRVLVVKSAQHFHAGFASIAAEIIYMAAPGAVAPDPRLLPYRRLDVANLYPWCDDPLALEVTA